MPTTNEISLHYREQFLAQQKRFATQYKGIFNKVANDIAAIASDPNAKFSKAFKFNTPTKKRIDKVINGLHKDALSLTEDQIKNAWSVSNSKNDQIVNEYLSTIAGLKSAQAAQYFLPNIPALQAFIGRSNDAFTLSDRVWKMAEQARIEMEIHLGMGIANGDSAQVISRRIRQYLENPDALFRRVRDEKGNLVASKAMEAYKSGQGVYKSAYKNAMRLARTETNMSYLLSDSLRWNQIDFVTGVIISLSSQHHITDICDDLVGTYPKDYVFTGFHPACLCHAVPDLMPKQDFREYLRSGGKTAIPDQLTEMPENFKSYIKENYDRYANYKHLPFFISENQKIVDEILNN